MSVSAAQAAAFYSEILKNGQVWTIRDSGGIPAPLNGDGDRSMPFWSLRSRAEKVIANVPAYADFEPVEIPLEIWRMRWIDGLERDGILIGLNWTAARATGYDFRPAEVRNRLAANVGTD
ncbi:DUF2750 domain-containing protein [Arthrobacter sp. ISL-85]|uniref:DUF2750 domain-containing protein n=1 Tax=Arthrobacter sp. ISL-85 TaxID=2819115 RepID=UPI001BE6EE5B|nr:DUF2750 domain-containing protein [Arthrobacter sp. ISL-85]MBT2568096.1 DUF2750 domain-containing protein [Arthrobacter sp. ISL-85]